MDEVRLGFEVPEDGRLETTAIGARPADLAEPVNTGLLSADIVTVIAVCIRVTADVGVDASVLLTRVLGARIGIGAVGGVQTAAGDRGVLAAKLSHAGVLGAGVAVIALGGGVLAGVLRAAHILGTGIIILALERARAAAGDGRMGTGPSGLRTAVGRADVEIIAVRVHVTAIHVLDVEAGEVLTQVLRAELVIVTLAVFLTATLSLRDLAHARLANDRAGADGAAVAIIAISVYVTAVRRRVVDAEVVLTRVRRAGLLIITIGV